MSTAENSQEKDRENGRRLNESRDARWAPVSIERRLKVKIKFAGVMKFRWPLQSVGERRAHRQSYQRDRDGLPDSQHESKLLERPLFLLEESHSARIEAVIAANYLNLPGINFSLKNRRR